ncbi:MAG: ribosome silencing factor [Verrucomicrobia bacterium]|nr:ribosome silencing factor [Verrucomicrobiota bacterium]
MRGLSSVADFYLVATGLNPPHLKALADELEKALARVGIRCFRRAGTPESGWVVADYLDAVVHIFSSNARVYYALERLWSDAPRME